MEHKIFVVKYQEELDGGNEELVRGYFEKVEIDGYLRVRKLHCVKFVEKHTCDCMTYKHEIDTES